MSELEEVTWFLSSKLKKEKKMIPIPNHKELAKGTLRAIMNQADLKLDDLLNLLG